MTDDVPFPNRDILERGIEKGVEWFLYKHSMGHINGYVKLPEGHKWLGLDYDDIPVEVHGGLTFGGSGSSFIGFDTAHAHDYWPNSTYEYTSLFRHDKHSRREWTQALVAEETKRLARQVADNVKMPLWKRMVKFFFALNVNPDLSAYSMPLWKRMVKFFEKDV